MADEPRAKHPWYGPCDALGPDGACVECLKHEPSAEASKIALEFLEVWHVRPSLTNNLAAVLKIFASRARQRTLKECAQIAHAHCWLPAVGAREDGVASRIEDEIRALMGAPAIDTCLDSLAKHEWPASIGDEGISNIPPMVPSAEDLEWAEREARKLTRLGGDPLHQNAAIRAMLLAARHGAQWHERERVRKLLAEPGNTWEVMRRAIAARVECEPADCATCDQNTLGACLDQAEAGCRAIADLIGKGEG